MNKIISEQQDIRTVETLINEAKELGMRVVHRPDVQSADVVSIEDYRVMSACVSPEVQS